ncbi:hypothetical protein ABK040_002283 [Willaertia magna]
MSQEEQIVVHDISDSSNASSTAEEFQHEYDMLIDFKIVNENGKMMDLESMFEDEQETCYAVGYIIDKYETNITIEGKEKKRFGPIERWYRDYSQEERPFIIISKLVKQPDVFHDIECRQPSDEYLSLYNKVYLKVCLSYNLMNVVTKFPGHSLSEIVSKVQPLNIPSKRGRTVKQKVTEELIFEHKDFITDQFTIIEKDNSTSSLFSSLFIQELNSFEDDQMSVSSEDDQKESKNRKKRKDREEAVEIVSDNESDEYIQDSSAGEEEEENLSDLVEESNSSDSDFKPLRGRGKGRGGLSSFGSSTGRGRGRGRGRGKKLQVPVNRDFIVEDCDDEELELKNNNSTNKPKEKKKRGRGRPRKDGSDPEPRNIDDPTDRHKKVITWTSESTGLDDSGRMYYTSCKVNDWELKIGDCCYLLPSDRYRYGYPYHVLLIDALFEDWRGVRFVRGRFILRYHDIVNILTGEELNVLCKDPQELFLSDTIEDNPLTSVMGKCVVFFLRDSKEFGKLDNIRQTRDTFYCTKKFVMGENYTSGLFKLSREDIKSTFTSLESSASFLLNQFRKDKPKLVALDIFSGCGGLSLGLHRAGIDVKYCIEFWDQAAETYRHNFKEAKVFCEDAEALLQKIKAVNELKERYKVNSSKKPSSPKRNDMKIEKLKMSKGKLNFYVNGKGYCEWYEESELDADVIVNFLLRKYSDYPRPGEIDLVCGGPPCQGFSGLNRFKERSSSEFMNHEKNRLMKIFIRYVNYFKPKYVLIENVSGLLNSSVFDVPRYIVKYLESYGYKTHYGCLNALHYGLPQSRTRVFFLGCKQDGVLPEFPEHTHAARRMGLVISSQHKKELAKHPHKVIGGFLPEITNRDIICDLNKFDLPNLGEEETEYENPPMTVYQEEYRKNSTVLHNHTAKGFGVVFTSLIRSMPRRPGANYNDLIEEAKPLLKEGYLNYRKNSKHILGRMFWSSRFYTIVTSVNPLSQTALHPNQNRVYSGRECCRAQGFPDDFFMTGTDADIYKQIGNAVPVNVAKCVGDEIVKAEMKFMKQKHSKKLNDKLELEKLLKHFNNCFENTKEWLEDEGLPQSEPLLEELISYLQPLPYELCDSVTLPKTRKDMKFEKDELPAIVEEHGDEIETEIKESVVDNEEGQEEEIVKELDDDEEEEELSEEEEEEDEEDEALKSIPKEDRVEIEVDPDDDSDEIVIVADD